MTHIQTPIWKQAAELRDALPWLLALGGMILGLLAWDFLVGRNAQVTYLGSASGALGNEVALNTDRSEYYVIPRGAVFASLKPNCRYDLNYTVPYGRYRGTQRPRYVRAATLVDCPQAKVP